jgi:hypothetical protein
VFIDDDPDIHPNTLKHLERNEVLDAWYSIVKSVRRCSRDDPPRWLSIGWLRDGRSVEIIAVELQVGWLIIHAMSPAQKRFIKEIEDTERGLL